MKPFSGPKNVVTGVFLMALAFWAGSQKNAVLGLFAFLCFFVPSIAFFFEAFRKFRKN